MNFVLMFLLGVWVAGCSHGLQEVSFAVPDQRDGVHYIVTRDVVSSRTTSTQPHTAGSFHCTGKYTSLEMANLRAEYGEHTWFKDCTPTQDMPMHKYALTGDQSWATVWQGPLSAAVLAGGLVGMAALWPEDNITQTGGGANASSGSRSVANATTKGGNATIRGPFRHGYRW